MMLATRDRVFWKWQVLECDQLEHAALDCVNDYVSDSSQIHSSLDTIG
jgi:hypothetical protein